MKLKHRHRLRRKEIVALSQSINEVLGIDPFDETIALDRASTPDFDVLITDGEIVGMIFSDTPYLSLRGILKYAPIKGSVTVDMGAIPYVINGADIMSPGITDIDQNLKEGSLAWIKDENNGKALAIVRILKDPKTIMEVRKGKAAKNIHFVGDDLWNTVV